MTNKQRKPDSKQNNSFLLLYQYMTALISIQNIFFLNQVFSLNGEYGKLFPCYMKSVPFLPCTFFPIYLIYTYMHASEHTHLHTFLGSASVPKGKNCFIKFRLKAAIFLRKPIAPGLCLWYPLSPTGLPEQLLRPFTCYAMEKIAHEIVCY